MPEVLSEFEHYMQIGVHQHAQGNYVDALSTRFQAYESANDAINRGRAARDIAASFYRLGETPLNDSAYTHPVTNNLLAEAYAEYAIREHEQYLPGLSFILDNAIELDDLVLKSSREFTVSAMYVAILEARQNRSEAALDYMSRAINVSCALHERYGQYHQYDVNLMGRAAGIQGVFDSKPYGLGMRFKAKKAIDLAKISETREVLGYDRSLTEKQVRQAQRKAKIRAYTARLLVGMAQLPTRDQTKPIAGILLNKIIL